MFKKGDNVVLILKPNGNLEMKKEENKFENIDFYIDFANKVPTNPDIFFYKSAMAFFTYFIQC